VSIPMTWVTAYTGETWLTMLGRLVADASAEQGDSSNCMDHPPVRYRIESPPLLVRSPVNPTLCTRA